MIEKKKIFISLALILSIGALLRIYNLGVNDFWYDEVASVIEAENVLNINTMKHSSPPLFGLLLHFWGLFGKDELTLRLLPLFCGVLSIIMIYRLGQFLFGKEAGLISALLLSISSFHIYYSQELRNYILFTLLALLSVFYLYKSLQKSNFFPWFFFIIFTTLCVYSPKLC